MRDYLKGIAIRRCLSRRGGEPAQSVPYSVTRQEEGFAQARVSEATPRLVLRFRRDRRETQEAVEFGKDSAAAQGDAAQGVAASDKGGRFYAASV